MTKLGWMYEHGQGRFPKDDARAVSWYRKAADAGDAAGMTNLGWILRTRPGRLSQG
jgi:TPR repeat protein